MASLDVTGAGSAAKAGLPSHLELACALLCCLRISLQRARKHVSHPHKIAMYMSWIPFSFDASAWVLWWLQSKSARVLELLHLPSAPRMPPASCLTCTDMCLRVHLWIAPHEYCREFMTHSSVQV